MAQVRPARRGRTRCRAGPGRARASDLARRTGQTRRCTRRRAPWLRAPPRSACRIPRRTSRSRCPGSLFGRNAASSHKRASGGGAQHPPWPDLTRAEIAQMRRQGSGAIVNTSSMLGAAAMPDNGPYVAAKHGVNGLTRTAALELGAAGIRVNALAPGVTRTGMTSSVSEDLLRRVPLNRIAEPDEIAAAAVWLCSPQASYITGAVLVADGGWLAG